MFNITPFLWFDGNAEEAAQFYVSTFPNSQIDEIVRRGDAGPGPEGSVLTVTFTLDGRPFVALNGGPHYQLTPAVSFFIYCETQDEIDNLWEKLGEGGTPLQCGWITDRFGLTWQVTPKVLLKMLADPDQEKADRVMKAMMQMVKLDIATLKRAYDQQ
jgi:predicted 3-demethylubiquinone-9 3-methyltransferase (glyoxalase superfamily)